MEEASITLIIHPGYNYVGLIKGDEEMIEEFRQHIFGQMLDEAVEYLRQRGWRIKATPTNPEAGIITEAIWVDRKPCQGLTMTLTPST